MGRIPGTSDFKGIGHYRAAMEVSGIKVFRFDAPLYFANAELFLTSMHRCSILCIFQAFFFLLLLQFLTEMKIWDFYKIKKKLI